MHEIIFDPHVSVAICALGLALRGVDPAGGMALRQSAPLMSEELRAAVLAEAETWRRTPWHHMARVKGAGIDCLGFLAEVYERAGVVEHVDAGFYRADFMRHRDDETYLDGVLRYGHEIAAPEPADVAMWKIGRVYSHAAIVIAWPRIIHADAEHGVIHGDGTQGKLAGKPVRFFTPFS